MSVGYPVTGTDLNNKAGNLVVTLWESLRGVADFAAWLNDATHDDAYLNSIGITGSSSTGDVKVLRDAFNDLNSLYNVAHNNGTVLANNNFFFTAKKLSGITLAN